MLRYCNSKFFSARVAELMRSAAVSSAAFCALLFASGALAEEQNAADTGEAVLPALPENLGRVPAPEVAPPVNRKKPDFVRVTLEAKPVTGLLADGVGHQYCTL